MPREYRFTCPLPNGLHARPASHLEAVANRFQAGVVMVNERNGLEANAKSVLSLIGSATLYKDPLCLRVSGDDEEIAIETLTNFLYAKFVTCDAALPEPGPFAKPGPAWPRSLRACEPTEVLRGLPVCRGVAEGSIVRIEGRPQSSQPDRIAAETPEKERDRFEQALTAVRKRLRSKCAAANEAEAGVLHAHLSILEDAALTSTVTKRLDARDESAASALRTTIEEFSTTLREIGSAYLRERVLDLQDIEATLLSEMYGPDMAERGTILTRPAIVVAASLTPGQFLELDRRYLRGLLLQHAGTTSHTIILARSFGIPTLVGAADAMKLAEGREVVLDANLGVLLSSPNAATRRFYAAETRKDARLQAKAEQFRGACGMSRDGQRMQILANVSSASEVAAAVEQGVEGVGLFRTEMLFVNRAQPPSEDEQAAAYAEAVRAAGGRPIILRTFDIGGDKPAPYLDLPSENNPFLGYRGARIYGGFADILRAQLHAIFRAARHGPVKIIAPMIASPDEMKTFRGLVEGVRQSFPRTEVPVGVMLEIPASVFAVPELCEWADFFSIGTNDLAQYFFAASRDDARLAPLCQWHQPAFLRLLKLAVDGARERGRPIGLCGEMAEEPDAQLILLGLGLDSLSMGVRSIAKAKANLARLDASRCREMAGSALRIVDGHGVESLLRDFHREEGLPLLTTEMVTLDADVRNKAEAIKELADLLTIAGRSTDAAAIEESVWTREETYPTSFGHGFAVPHCKTDHLTANSIIFLRPRSPIEWGSLDGGSVRTVILLAVRGSDHAKEHLRIFSRLSRLLMRQEFRTRLETASDASAVLAAFREELSF